MNKVILMGRLTKDPEVRYTNGDQPMCVARYTLAVDRRGKQQDGQPTADFIRCVAFSRAGEFAEKYFHKGLKLVIAGRIQTGSYKNKDGQTVYTTDVVIEEQNFAESKASADARPAQSTSQSTETTGPDGFMYIPDGAEDDGLPFN